MEGGRREGDERREDGASAGEGGKGGKGGARRGQESE